MYLTIYADNFSYIYMTRNELFVIKNTDIVLIGK